MREIPQHIIERDKQGVENLTYYGVSVTELDRDELLAALNLLGQKAQRLALNYWNLMELNQLIRQKYRCTSTERGQND